MSVASFDRFRGNPSVPRIPVHARGPDFPANDYFLDFFGVRYADDGAIASGVPGESSIRGSDSWRNPHRGFHRADCRRYSKCDQADSESSLGVAFRSDEFLRPPYHAQLRICAWDYLLFHDREPAGLNYRSDSLWHL